jgi:dehydrogenase/reductase SDR family protein 12
MRDRVCIVTGANAGIGKATALGLAGTGATVVMLCRSRERGEAALASIRDATGNDRVERRYDDRYSRT